MSAPLARPGDRRGPAGRWTGPLLAVIWAAGTTAIAQVSPQSAAEFSAGQLEQGKEAWADKRNLEAVSHLQIAAFGFLDRPESLCEALIYLALASDAAGRQPQARTTVQRLLEIESAFPSCAAEPIGADVHAQFETRFRQRLPNPAPAAAGKADPPPRPLLPPPPPTPKP